MWPFFLFLSALVRISADLCPISGQAPKVSSLPLPRCGAFGPATCCSGCNDYATAISVIGRNGTQVLDIVAPGLAFGGSGLSGNLQLCSFFAGHPECLELIESMYCGFLCDGRASSYFSVSNNTGKLRLCNAFAVDAYNKCKSIIIPGINSPVSLLFPSPVDFVATIVAPIATSATTLKTIVPTVIPASEGTTNCFNGPPGNVFPTVPLCCDELSDTPSYCIAPTDQDIVKYAPTVINRTLSPTTCPNTVAANSTSNGTTTSTNSSSATPPAPSPSSNSSSSSTPQAPQNKAAAVGRGSGGFVSMSGRFIRTALAAAVLVAL